MSAPAVSTPGIFHRLAKNRVALAACAVLAFVALAAIFGPMLMPRDAAVVTSAQFFPPSPAHFFGTDLNGRDVLFRVLEGARISLLVGFSGALISLIVGTAYGLV